MISFDKTRFE